MLAIDCLLRRGRLSPWGRSAAKTISSSTDRFAAWLAAAGAGLASIFRPPLDITTSDERDGEAHPNSKPLYDSCRDDTFHFDRARSLARYQDSLVRAIVLLKFEEMDPLSDWFAKRLVEVVQRASLDATGGRSGTASASQGPPPRARL